MGPYGPLPFGPVMADGFVAASAMISAAAVQRGESTGKGSGGGGAAPGVSVRHSRDFVVTPLFANVSLDASGRAVASFTAPPNLGTFVVRWAGRQADMGMCAAVRWLGSTGRCL